MEKEADLYYDPYGNFLQPKILLCMPSIPIVLLELSFSLIVSLVNFQIILTFKLNLAGFGGTDIDMC